MGLEFAESYQKHEPVHMRATCTLKEGQSQLAGGSNTFGHRLDPHVYVVPELNTHTTRLGNAGHVGIHF